MDKRAYHAFGDQIRALREAVNLPLRKVAAELDIDPSTLSKIERGERSASKEMIPIFARMYNASFEELNIMFLSDRVAEELVYEQDHEEILKVAEEKIKYLKSKEVNQGKLDLK